MPGIHIEFTQEEYDRIPSKKRTWVKNLVLEHLPEHPASVYVPTAPAGVPKNIYVFMTDNGALKAEGTTPAEAAKSIGLGFTVSWKTIEEAREAGWIE